MSLGISELAFDGGYSRCVTHRPTLVVSSFLTPQHVMTDFRNNGVGVCNTLLNLADDSTCLRNAITDVRDGYRRASRKRGR
jgi:hypothetical protein